MSEGKITGEEDRYSGTDLWDFAANVAGSEGRSSPRRRRSKAKDADLDDKIESGFAEIHGQLQAYADGDGLQAVRRADDGRHDQDEDRRWPRCPRTWPRWPACSA